MSMTDEELRLALGSDEPQYASIAARLEASDIPRVRAIAEGSDTGMATKAVYLASLLASESAHEIVERAAQSANELVRIASASGLSNLPVNVRDRISVELLGRPNAGISK